VFDVSNLGKVYVIQVVHLLQHDITKYYISIMFEIAIQIVHYTFKYLLQQIVKISYILSNYNFLSPLVVPLDTVL